MANIRDYLYKMGLKKIGRSAQRDGGKTPRQGRFSPLTDAGRVDKDGVGSFSLDKVHHIELQKNPNPEKQTISRMPTKWERRFRKAKRGIKAFSAAFMEVLYQLWDLRWWRDKSPREIEREREMEKRRKLQATLQKESDLYAKRISNSYARLGYRHVPRKEDRNLINNTRKVRFSQAVGEPNAIWLKIDIPSLPHGVDLMKIIDDENVLSNISGSCRHHVESIYHVEKGAWLCVERGRGTRGIPNAVNYKRMMELMPVDRDNLTVPLGETRNSKRIYRSFKPFPHMLVGGATGNGKTNHLNMVMCSLIQRNSPQDIKFILVDLKNGIEFDAYRGLPHLWKIPNIAPEGIVGRNDNVIPLLKHLIKEGERRLEVFKKAGVTNIEDYNRHKREGRMERIFFIIDEWARIALRSDGNQADELLSEITATYRAVGFHVIVATQTPKVKVISTLIKTNLSARLAFGVPSNPESLVILDNGRARGLQPPGRAIFKFGMTEVEIQTPLVDHTAVKRIVAEATERGGEVDTSNRLSMEDIMRYSLKKLNGSLAVRPLYDHFQNKVGHKSLVGWLQKYDEEIINIDGQSYQVIPPNGGAVPRKLEKFPSDEPPNTPERSEANLQHTTTT